MQRFWIAPALINAARGGFCRAAGPAPSPRLDD
jgi:hypothetical protein